MASQGWIKLHRQLQNCFLWNDKPFAQGQAWVDLLLLANHENVKTPYKGEIITCERGTVNRSISQLAERWGWNRKKVRRFLSLLESDNMVSVNSTTHRTTITLINYDNFQLDGSTNGTTNVQQVSNKWSTNVQQVSTNKNDKKEKNEKNDKNEKNIREIFYPDDEELNQTFSEYVQMRKKIKKPFTSDHAIQLAINKLDKLSKGDSQLAIDIINESIEHSWIGLFELKQNKTNSYRGERNLLDELNACV